ncbi:MAG: hypothetical protein HYS43_00570 [Candidatus Liptonbacteria bacterium]|nr:hypothetical protein [Candidatus Liptonbacteria bacterium]
MKYTIYFHGGCTDGVASAAVLSHVLRERGDAVSALVPMSFPRTPAIWKKTKFKKPFAIVDFLYRPDAAIWFDHHPTTFFVPEWKRDFVSDNMRILDMTRPSCTGFIVAYARTIGIALPKRFLELARWLDIFDAAKFKSPKEALRLRYPAEQIHAALSEDNSASFQRFLVVQLRDRSLADVARLPRVQKRFRAYKKKFDRSIAKLRTRFVVENGVAFADVSDRSLVGSRFAVFSFYRNIRYVVRLVRHKCYELSVGENPWRRSKNGVHIGNLLRDRFGGGGHPYVGGAVFPTKKKALQAAREIVQYLKWKK